MTNAQAANPVFDREVGSKIGRMLGMRGFRVETTEKADYVVTYGYGINPGLRSDSVATYGPPVTEIVPVPDGKGGITTRAVTLPGPVSLIPTVTMQYAKHLTLKVADAARMRSEKQEYILWVGETFSNDQSSDLRYDIDYLIVAAFRYFGQDTGKQVHVSIGKENPEVMDLRRGESPAR